MHTGYERDQQTVRPAISNYLKPAAWVRKHTRISLYIPGIGYRENDGVVTTQYGQRVRTTAGYGATVSIDLPWAENEPNDNLGNNFIYSIYKLF